MKRVTAIILATIILFTSFTPVVATENSTTQTENKKIQWLVENNFLVGRRKDGDLKLGSTITRAEFTRMALVAKGEEDAAKEYPNVSTKFKDVDENHWATKLIAYASEKGYISGYPDGNFKPEGDITYEEIISILARIHPNYTKIETKSNGWAEGFIKFATENGTLEGLKIESSYKSSAIREKTFEMIYNFINIENNHVKETKSTKPIETKNENYFGWNGFYPYWFQFGYRPRAEKPVEPEVKPEPGTPDVKPEPEEPKEPETPETPKEFDKEKITKIEVKDQPTKLNYTEGEQLDLTGLEVTLTDNQGITKEVGLDKFGEYGITTSPENGTPLTVDHNGKSVVISKGEAKAETDPLTVKFFDKDNITKIEVITQPKLEYFEREFLDLTGLKVRLTDNKGTTKEVEFKDFNEYGIKTRPSNDRQLLMSMYKEVEIYKDTIKTTTDPLIIEKRVFDINLLDSIGIERQPKKRDYIKGENLNLYEMRIRLVDIYGASETFGVTGIIAKGYKLEITPSDGTVLGIEHNEQPVIVKVNNKQTKTKPIHVYLKIDFMKTKDDVHSTKVIQLYTSVKKPDDPTREGYKFMGWYTDLTFETEFDFDKALNDNMEVYAKWEAI